MLAKAECCRRRSLAARIHQRGSSVEYLRAALRDKATIEDAAVGGKRFREETQAVIAVFEADLQELRTLQGGDGTTR